MKNFILPILFLISIYGKAQIPYIDGLGFGARYLEKLAVEGIVKESKKTRKEYIEALTIRETEEFFTKTKIQHSYRLIEEYYYRDICNDFVNPFKKNKCIKKKEYLMYSFKVLYDTYSSGRFLDRVNIGVKEQILEKYISISNILITELEDMKNKAEKRKFINRIIPD